VSLGTYTFASGTALRVRLTDATGETLNSKRIAFDAIKLTPTSPTPAPTITSFSPTSGSVGTSVTITGTSLTGASAVRFNGVSATGFTVSSATQIAATVPAGATTGPIGVTTPGGTATSATNFTFGTTTELIIDDTSGGFTKGGSYWREDTRGYGGHQWWTYVNGSKVDCWGEWRANLGGGSYEVFVYIPRYNTTSQTTKYTIYHQGGTAVKAVNQNIPIDQWVSLGVYTFAAGVTRQVRLTDATGEAVNSRVLAFDAVRFTPR